jgi:hypothetical protein
MVTHSMVGVFPLSSRLLSECKLFVRLSIGKPLSDGVFANELTLVKSISTTLLSLKGS